jgi:hypothetical protein
MSVDRFARAALVLLVGVAIWPLSWLVAAGLVAAYGFAWGGGRA